MKTPMQEILKLESDLTRMFDSDQRVAMALLEHIRENRKEMLEKEKEHNVDRQYTINEVIRCVEHWGLCKVEKEYIENFLNKPQTEKEL